MRKNTASAESASEAPTEKKHHIPRKKESRELEAGPELGTADRFMADAKEFMRLKGRIIKHAKEIETVREAGLTLSAVEKSIAEEDLPNIKRSMAAIADKYGSMADRFIEDAEAVHNAEQAAKKFEDKKEKAIMRAQISDIAAKFVRHEEKPSPDAATTKRAITRKTIDPGIQHAASTLDERPFISATERPIIAGTENDTADSVLNEARTISNEIYSGDSSPARIAAETETTASAIADIQRDIESIQPAEEDRISKKNFILPPPPVEDPRNLSESAHDTTIGTNDTENDFFKKGENIDQDNLDEAAEIAKEAAFAKSDEVRYKDLPMSERTTTEEERAMLATRHIADAGDKYAELGNAVLADLERDLKEKHGIDVDTLPTMSRWEKMKLEMRSLINSDLRKSLDNYRSTRDRTGDKIQNIVEDAQGKDYWASRNKRGRLSSKKKPAIGADRK